MPKSPSFIVLLALSLAACGEEQPMPQSPTTQDSAAQPALVLVKQKPSPDHAELQALGGGMLTLKDGCLRLVNGDNSRLVLWSPEAIPTDDGVFDPTTGSTVRIGEPIVIGGGEIDGVDPSGLSDTIPEACSGPYWLAARGFFPAPKEEWATVRIAEKFSIKVREAMRPATPASALPAMLADDSLALTVTEGRDVCDGPLADPQSRHWAFNVYSDQRMARVVRQKTGPDTETIDAVFRGVEGPRGVTPPVGEVCLRVTVQCDTGHDCDHARAMLSTIRFGDLGEPD